MKLHSTGHLLFNSLLALALAFGTVSCGCDSKKTSDNAEAQPAATCCKGGDGCKAGGCCKAAGDSLACGGQCCKGDSAQCCKKACCKKDSCQKACNQKPCGEKKQCGKGCGHHGAE